MSHEQVFLPNNKPLNISLIWWMTLTLPIVIPSLRLDFTTGNLATEAVISLFLVILMVLPLKVPESITVSVEDHILLYRYYNCWGRLRSIKVDLQKVRANYKCTALGKVLLYWRLKLYYRHSGLHRLVIKQDNKGGFNKQQLDEISYLIGQCTACSYNGILTA